MFIAVIRSGLGNGGYIEGDLEKSDGSKYKGRGYIQLTGKSNYKKYFAEWKKQDNSRANIKMDKFIDDY